MTPSPHDTLYLSIDLLKRLLEDPLLPADLRPRVKNILRLVADGTAHSESLTADLRMQICRNPEFYGDLMGRPADDFEEDFD